MAFPVREDATHKVIIGPVVAVGDGFTPVTTLAVSSSDEAEAILHDNGTVVDISGYTFAAITTADGYYHLTLQTGISGTLGHMRVVINDDSLCLPVYEDFIIIDGAAYDRQYGGTITLPGQEAPPLAPTEVELLGWLYKMMRNRKDNDGTTAQLYADNETTVDAKSTLTEASGTVTQQEWVTGP